MHPPTANPESIAPAGQSRGSPLIGRRRLCSSAVALAAAAAVPPMRSAGAAAASAPAPEARSLPAPLPLSQRQLGFMLAHEQFPATQLLFLGAQAEKAGFTVLCTSDHIQPWQTNQGHAGEAWVTMGGLTQHTHTTWIGPTVTCPTLRYAPAVVAECYATLSLARPGRIFLGIGSGEALNEQAATGQWPAWQERWERLIEAATIIRALWSGEPLNHTGKYYTVKGRLYVKPPEPIPLLMAANGPKAMRLAGQHGDGLITDPDTWKQHKSLWQAGVRASGRDPATLPVLVEQFVVVGDQADATMAAQLWRFLPKAFKGYQDIADPAEIQRRAEAEIDIHKLIGQWPVSTDPEPHIKTIASLFQSGVTLVNIHSGQPDQQRVIDFYAEQVIPRLRAGTTGAA